MPEQPVDTHGGPAFSGDFHGTYIGHDLIIAIQGYTGDQLAVILGELRRLLSSGAASLEAHLALGRLQVRAPGARPIILSEQAAEALLPLAVAQESEEAYLSALVVQPRYGVWSTQYVELAGNLTEVTRPAGWGELLRPEYVLYELEAGAAQKQVRRTPLADITLALQQHPHLALLGAPGSGKTTSLERLALQAAHGRLSGSPGKIPLLLPLADYRGQESIYAFVQSQWQQRLGGLELNERLRSGQLCMLFDALNEMPFSDLREYRRKVNDLRKFVQEDWPGNQALFTCRSRDYSEPLGLAQVEIEPLSTDRIQNFLGKRLGAELGAGTWQRLKDSPLLPLASNPYYLNMLSLQVADGGAWPESRAGLFKGFVGRLTKREKLKNQPGWVGEAALERALVKLAAYMQPQGEGTRLARPQAVAAIRLLDETLDARDPGEPAIEAELAVKFGLDASLLDVEAGPDDQEQVRFYHHQLQEYFAARALLARYRAGQPMQRFWRGPINREEMPSPGSLREFEPLPLPPSTGWEEPSVTAVGLAADPASKVDLRAILRQLLALNPVLAARCLREPGLPDLPELAQQARQALLAQMAGERVHRRSRLAAGLALGELGDPRFVEVQQDGVRLRLAPFVHLPGEEAQIGTSAWKAFWLERRGWAVSVERPRHTVNLQPFWIGKFPVTNAEFRCFWEAGGYADDRYWQTEAGRAWRTGEDVGETAGSDLWALWKSGHEQPQEALARLRKAGLPAEQLSDFEEFFRMDESQAKALIREQYEERERTKPAFWDDSRYNNPAQPVVGVTWYEALAYCAWLEQRLRNLDQAGESPGLPAWLAAHPDLQAGLAGGALRVRLPAEAEWEWAARGASQRAYPWGERFDEERANTSEGRLGRTTPVGMYPLGASPQGAQELSGNVWEWTSSLYQKYPIRAGDGREDLSAEGRRVVRGGSWVNLRWRARCAYRFRGIPAYFNDYVGFRLVLSLAPAGF